MLDPFTVDQADTQKASEMLAHWYTEKFACGFHFQVFQLYLYFFTAHKLTTFLGQTQFSAAADSAGFAIASSTGSATTVISVVLAARLMADVGGCVQPVLPICRWFGW